jgi:acyl-CoA synthetase (AMP-forming)/AMP-acid ligase II
VSVIDADAAAETVLAPARIPEILGRARPDAVAIEVDGEPTTYAALAARSDAVARALVGAGLTPGARVALLMASSARVFEILFGAARARLATAPLNPRLAPPEVARILDDARPAILFVSPELQDLAVQALALTHEAPRVVVAEGRAFESFLAEHVAADPLPAPSPQDDLLLLYTSGTTGTPKGVRHTHATYQEMLRLSHDIPGFAYGADDVVLDVMPLCHVAGLNSGLMTFAGGGRLVVLSRFEPGAALAAIAGRRVTKTLLAPVMIRMLLEAPEIGGADLSSLKVVCYGASPISPDLLAQAHKRLGCDLMQLYGMTELAGPATVLRPEEHQTANRLASCGRPWPGMEVKVINGAGRSLGPGAIGQVVVRGPNMTPGYAGDPEATALALRDGWLHTGDAGYFDDQGFLFIRDRIKDMIVSGGENIYPAEVEHILTGCPGVADAAVIGTPSEVWGEAVTALLVRKPGAELDADEVRTWLRGRIAGYKIPKRVEFIDAIPRNAAGKILRRELRAPFWASEQRAVN